MGIRVVGIFILAALHFSCNENKLPSSGLNDFDKRLIDHQPSPIPLSPSESIRKIQVPPGYKVELVASEPMIQDPVALAWDGDGAMYVVQMNTFMTDAKGTDQYKPISQIKRLTDTDNDGIMDKSTVFIDSLLLPRVILPVGDELIVGITNIQNLYAYKDTDHDGKADQKRIVFENPAIDARNMEHQNGGLIWNLDNWIYPSRDNLRFKYKSGKLIADTMIDNMIGQWGMTTDDFGRLYYSEAGPGLPVVQFNQMPAYGSLNFSDQYPDDFTIPYPIMSTIDAQGGSSVLMNEDSTLTHFTSGCGQSIFRGDRLPEDMRGDYFVAEPVARIIKRGKVISIKGKRIVENAYQGKDWLASSDFNFRPVNTYTGPDGCFYIVDMYHGIIQEGEFAEEDSYLNKKIKELGLEKNIGLGRIYRVTHENFKRDPVQPKLLSKSSSELIPYLSHPNSWWRDMAQQLIIIHGDTSVKSSLEKIVIDHLSNNRNHLAALHSLWSLEGLDVITPSIVLKAAQSKEPTIRKASIWLGEKWINKNDLAFIKSIEPLKNDSDPDVVIQLYLSLRNNTSTLAKSIVEYILQHYPDNEVIQYSHSVFKESYARAQAEQERINHLSNADKKLIAQGAITFKQFCSNCHGPDGKGIKIGNTPMPAPPLSGSPRVNGDKIMLIQIALFGLKGPVDDKIYPGVMLPQKHQSDEWIASVLSYIRNSNDLGNKSSTVTKEEVEDIRKTAVIDNGIPDQRLLEIYKLGRGEAQNWSKGKPGSNGHKWGGEFRSMVKDSVKK
ncbi:MAG: c-type cytochrome [Saprospiraceae bacterium]